MPKSVTATCTYIFSYYAFTVLQVSALLPDEVNETSERILNRISSAEIRLCLQDPVCEDSTLWLLRCLAASLGIQQDPCMMRTSLLI